MRNAIILHGMPSEQEYYDKAEPSESNRNWLPWLQRQLQLRDIPATTPEIYKAYKPKWRQWVREVERFDITAETMLVGHSCGGGFWIRYLSEHPEIQVGKVVLVAPWLDPDGDETDGFFDFQIDPRLVSRTGGMTIFNSDNDIGNVHKSVAMLRRHVEGIQYREFHKYGHFRQEDIGSLEFPELFEALTQTYEDVLASPPLQHLSRCPTLYSQV